MFRLILRTDVDFACLHLKLVTFQGTSHFLAPYALSVPYHLDFHQLSYESCRH